ncbi:MAG TPA: DUF4231 domain-containing protein [Alloacidobacterium sp.]|nr:DUF4231 domain-containing protein [Alloacidobacterium sp.]
MADAAAADPIFQRLEDQIAWYSSKSRAAQKYFKRIKIVEIIAAAMIPFLGAFSKSIKFEPYLTPTMCGLGALITILEGILHLNQYQQNWTTYRATAEALKHEKFVYIAKAGPYAGASEPRALLAERVESLVSQENSQWTSTQQQAAKPQSTGTPG